MKRAQVWHLHHRPAHTVKVPASGWWLRVRAGEVWLTQVQQGATPKDLWPQAGESLWLPGGSTWVLQAWREADVECLVPLPQWPTQAPRRPPWWSRWAHALAATMPVRPPPWAAPPHPAP